MAEELRINVLKIEKKPNETRTYNKLWKREKIDKII